MTKRKVSAVEARRRLGELLDSVDQRGDEVVIERDGKPVAVLIPAERYASMESSRDRLGRMISEARERNRDVPPEVIEAEVDEAIREVRHQAKSRAS
jgi:prevent-host-death family protein